MRLRFTIRDLLWLTALVAVLVAWWLDRRHLQWRVDNPFPNGATLSPDPAGGYHIVPKPPGVHFTDTF